MPVAPSARAFGLVTLSLALLLIAGCDRPPLRDYRIEVIDEASGPSHTLAIGRIGGESLAFVADEDGSAVLTFGLDDMRFVSRTRLPGVPSSVRLLSSGELAVTLRERAQVAFLGATADGLRVRGTTDVCEEPVSTNATDDKLYVVCGWGHAIDTVSLRTHARKAHLELPREPRAAVLDPFGRTLYVSHAVGSRLSIVDTASGRLSEVSLSVDGMPLLEGLAAEGQPDETQRPRFASQGFTLAYVSRSLQGGRLLLPEVLVAPREAPKHVGPVLVPPPARSDGYGGSVAGASFFGPPPERPSALAHVATLEVTGATAGKPQAPSGANETGCLLPRAAAATVDGRVFVACLGSDDVLEYNGLASDPDAAIVARTRVSQGPTGLAYADHVLYVWSAYDRILTRIENRTGSGDGYARFVSDGARSPTPFEVGRRLFHRTGSDAISADGRGCASCHPDGRDDGLVWSSPDGPRQTPMLAGRLADTAPYGWTGSAATVRDHLRQTFKRLGGQGVDDRALYALLTYCAKMPSPPTAALSLDDPRIAAGKRVFESYDAGCSSCHDPSSGFADGENHDVGSSAPGDSKRAFQTPSLRGVAGTAPYFHDGRYASLEDLLRGSREMADTSRLSDADLRDLAAYLQTL